MTWFRNVEEFVFVIDILAWFGEVIPGYWFVTGSYVGENLTEQEKNCCRLLNFEDTVSKNKTKLLFELNCYQKRFNQLTMLDYRRHGCLKIRLWTAEKSREIF